MRPIKNQLLTLAAIVSSISSAQGATICSCMEIVPIDPFGARDWITVVELDGYREFTPLGTGLDANPSAYLYWEGGSIHFETTFQGEAAESVVVSLLGEPNSILLTPLALSDSGRTGSDFTFFASYQPFDSTEENSLRDSTTQFEIAIQYPEDPATFLTTSTFSPNTVPEPTSSMMACLASVFFVLRRNKKNSG